MNEFQCPNCLSMSVVADFELDDGWDCHCEICGDMFTVYREDYEDEEDEDVQS